MTFDLTCCFTYVSPLSHCSHLQLSRMKYALHAILIVLEKIALGLLNGFGVERHTWQREGMISGPLLFSELNRKMPRVIF